MPMRIGRWSCSWRCHARLSRRRRSQSSRAMTHASVFAPRPSALAHSAEISHARPPGPFTPPASSSSAATPSGSSATSPRRLGAKRVLVVTDPILREGRRWSSAVRGPLARGGRRRRGVRRRRAGAVAAGRRRRASPRPRQFRPDAVLGLGGGSNMDLAKITADGPGPRRRARATTSATTRSPARSCRSSACRPRPAPARKCPPPPCSPTPTTRSRSAS